MEKEIGWAERKAGGRKRAREINQGIEEVQCCLMMSEIFKKEMEELKKAWKMSWTAET